MIISPGLKSDPSYSQHINIKSSTSANTKKPDNTINLRMDEIDSYPSHNDMTTAVNFKEIKEFKIKDLIK